MGLGCFEEDWGTISGTGFKKCCITNALDGTEGDLMTHF
jgi:hypothetical protein